MAEEKFNHFCVTIVTMKSQEFKVSFKAMLIFWMIPIFFLVSFAVIWWARNVIAIIFIAFFLALALNKPTDFFAKKLPNHNRSLSATIVFLIAIGLMSGVITLLIPVFVEQSLLFIQSLPSTIAAAEEQVKPLLEYAQDYGLREAIMSSVNDTSSELVGVIKNIGNISFMGDALNGLFDFFLICILTFFMLVGGPTWIKNFWNKCYTDKKRREYHQDIAKKMYDVVSVFFTSQVIIAAINAILSGLGVFVLALTFGFTMSLILPVASIVFVTTFMPVIGPVINSVITGLLLLLYNPIAALIFVIYLVVFQQIVYNIVAPKIQGKRMNMPAIIVLIAMIAGLKLGGVVGALIAIPIAGCITVLIREIIDRRAKKQKKSPQKSKANVTK